MHHVVERVALQLALQDGLVREVELDEVYALILQELSGA